jgi:hypothetical protein
MNVNLTGSACAVPVIAALIFLVAGLACLLPTAADSSLR